MPRLVLLVAASLGLAVVARAAAMYRGTDPLAFALVLAIGTGLLVGLVELWQRATRADRLGRHLQSLPRPASLSAIETAPEPLRAMLLSRTAGTPFLAQGASLATYLLGMLVMLGMLGTFLGLFESLRGAREALTATGGDVDALRAGLASPMVGLSRAFGTSATGVSASALLGLSLVFTRREEARFSRQLSSYVAGPLQALTVQGRMLAALEAVASSTTALPTTSASMQAALSQVANLEDQIARERKETSDRLIELTASLVAEVRSSFATMTKETRASLETTGQKTSSAIEALSEKTASLLRETSREQLEASRASQEATALALRSMTEETSASLHASIEKATLALREAGTEAAGSMREAGKQASTGLLELGREASTSLRELSETTQAAFREASEETTKALSKLGGDVTEALRASSEEASSSMRALSEETRAALRALAEETSESLRGAGESTSSALREVGEEATLALRESAREQLQASGSAMEQAGTALSEAALSTRDAMARASAEIGASLSKAAEEASVSAKEASASITAELRTALEEAAEGAAAAIGPIAEKATDRAGEVATAHLSRWLERMERDADERRTREAELSSRLSSIVDSVAGSVSKLAEETRAQSTELRTLAEEVRAQGEQVSKATEAKIAEVAEQARLALELQATALSELEERLEKARTELGSALVSRIEEHASELRETSTATATLAKDAAELLRGGSAEISAAAELLTGAIDRHREASEKWLDGVALAGSEPLSRPTDAEPLADSQERTREALEHVVELQREMITEIRALRPAEAEAAEG